MGQPWVDMESIWMVFQDELSEKRSRACWHYLVDGINRPVRWFPSGGKNLMTKQWGVLFGHLLNCCIDCHANENRSSTHIYTIVRFLPYSMDNWKGVICFPVALHCIVLQITLVCSYSWLICQPVELDPLNWFLSNVGSFPFIIFVLFAFGYAIVVDTNWFNWI